MSFNQWKFLNFIKDIVTKFTIDKSLPNPSEITNEFLQTIQKLSTYIPADTKIVQSTNTIERSLISNNKLKDLQFLPDMKNRILMPYKSEQNITPKWKVKIFSEVSTVFYFFSK